MNLPLYKEAIKAMAMYELELIKNSDVEFKIDADTFNPSHDAHCFYGQQFEKYRSDDALAFIKSNKIPIGFSFNNYDVDYKMTALQVHLMFIGKRKSLELLKEFIKPTTYKWEYTIPTSGMWSSLDHGIVEANNREVAIVKAIALVNAEVNKMNEVLGDIGMTVDIDTVELNVRKLS